MYPKHLVYCENTEYSLEEIRARRNSLSKFQNILLYNENEICEDVKNSVKMDNGNVLTRDRNFTIFQDEAAGYSTAALCKNQNDARCTTEPFSVFTDDDMAASCSSTAASTVNSIAGPSINFAVYENDTMKESQTIKETNITLNCCVENIQRNSDPVNHFNNKVVESNKIFCIYEDTDNDKAQYNMNLKAMK